MIPVYVLSSDAYVFRLVDRWMRENNPQILVRYIRGIWDVRGISVGTIVKCEGWRTTRSWDTAQEMEHYIRVLENSNKVRVVFLPERAWLS
jgi:hypothetical protein